MTVDVGQPVARARAVMIRRSFGLGLLAFDPATTGGCVLRGVGGGFWGTMFFTVSSGDGAHVVSVHANTELRDSNILREVFETAFGFTFQA